MALEYVYIIEFTTGFKIGRTNNPLARLRVYRSPWCTQIKDIRLWTVADASKCESLVIFQYGRLIKNSLSREWISKKGTNPKVVKKNLCLLIEQLGGRRCLTLPISKRQARVDKAYRSLEVSSGAR